MIIPNKHDGWVKSVRRVYDGGGGGSAPSSTTQTTDLPDWAKPYAQETLAATKGQVFKTDEAGKITGYQPYQTYDQPRIAGFSPMQQQAQQAAAQMGTSGQLSTGTGLATAAGLMGLGANYQPGYFGNQFRAPGAYQTGQFDYLGAQAPDLQQYQMGPAERVAGGQYTAPEMTAAQTGYRPDLQQFQMGPAQQVGTQDYTGGNVAKYMDPYMQQVVDVQQREAQRQSAIAGTQEAGQAVKMGAFGGSRAGLLEAERQRNLATQLGNIQATGSQAAFQNAQQQFNQQQQRELAAQQANQQAGLTAGGQNLAAALGVQQLGTQTGLQTALANLNNQQQAAVQNQAAQLQAQGLTAGQAMQAALANQQAGLNVGQQNLAAQLGIQQLGAGQNMQAQLANQQAYQDMLRQREASRQFGYGQQMTAAQLRAQYGQAAQQLAEQSRQFGAGYGQQGLNTALQAAGQLGNLGQAEFGQRKDILGLQSQFGAQQQALQQQGLSQAYQDFLNQQNHPYKQLGFMSDMIRGLPLGQQSTAQMYQAPGSMMGQVAGLGTGLMGLAAANKQFGFFNEGGEVQEYADGGSVDSSQNVADIVDGLSDQQLAQAKQAAQARGDKAQLDAIEEEEGMRASERRGMASAFNNLSQNTQQRMMAGGGIVAFAGGGPTPEEIEAAKKPYVGYPMAARPADKQYGESNILKRVGEFLLPSAYAVDKPTVDASNASFDRAEEKRLSQDRAPTTVAKAKPAAKAPKMNASISSAVSQMARESGVPEESLRSIYESYEKSFNDKSAAEMKSFMAMAEKSMGGSKQVKEQALGRALAEFGFKWAAEAAKPGAKFIGSAATAAPTIAASTAESAKLAREMDQNDMKLRLNLKQFEIAQRKGDLATAASLAAQERQLIQQGRQLELARDQLAETSRHNRAREALIGQRNAAASSGTSDRLARIKSQLAMKAATEAKDYDDPYKGMKLKQQYPSRQAYQKALFDQMWSQSIPLEHVGTKDPDEE